MMLLHLREPGAVGSNNAAQEKEETEEGDRPSVNRKALHAMNFALKRLTLMTLDRVTINTRVTNRTNRSDWLPLVTFGMRLVVAHHD